MPPIKGSLISHNEFNSRKFSNFGPSTIYVYGAIVKSQLLIPSIICGANACVVNPACFQRFCLTVLSTISSLPLLIKLSLMAASSFVSETCHSYFVDLKHVNRRLEWNPYPRDRVEAMQELWWDWIDRRDKDLVSGSVRRYHREHALEDAKECAEQYTRPLANYYGGRIILDAEDPRQHASDYSFWLTRAEYYRLEHEKLEEDFHWASRSVTPGAAYPGLPWYTELDRAKCD